MGDDESQLPPRMSRSGRTSVYGGRNERIAALVSRDVKDEVTRRRGSVGMTESEWFSAFLEVHLFGLDHARKLHEDRLGAIAGIERQSVSDRTA